MKSSNAVDQGARKYMKSKVQSNEAFYVMGRPLIKFVTYQKIYQMTVT